MEWQVGKFITTERMQGKLGIEGLFDKCADIKASIERKREADKGGSKDKQRSIEGGGVLLKCANTVGTMNKEII